MCKKLFLFVSVLLLVGTPAFAVVGVFDYTEDIGTKGPGGVGYHGMGFTHDMGDGSYVITAGGKDIDGREDRGFHYAYKLMNGDFRLTADFGPWLAVDEDWAKHGPMIRADSDPDSVNFFMLSKRKGDTTALQRRLDKGGNTGYDGRVNNQTPTHMNNMGIQRFSFGPLQYIEAFKEVGGVWELVASRLTTNLPQEVMAGIALTAHKDNDGPDDDPWQEQPSDGDNVRDSIMAQLQFSNVEYSANPEMLGDGFDITEIPVEGISDDCRDPGFLIRVQKCGPGTYMDGADDEAQYVKAAELMDTGKLDGVWGIEWGERIDQVVNLWDKGGHGNFPNNENYYPGVDTTVAGDPADDDDDDHFAVEVLACVDLTAGEHIFGAHMDDGVKVEVGGVEIGRTSKWNSTDMFLFTVPVDGMYSFRALGFEKDGGGDLELLEMIQTATGGEWVLLGEGPTNVYVPEPATIALLGFGGLTLLRIRKKR